MNNFFNFNLKGLFKEKYVTAFKICGNRIIVNNLTGGHSEVVKFKNATKLKKFFEKWCVGKNITYVRGGVFGSPDILNFKIIEEKRHGRKKT